MRPNVPAGDDRGYALVAAVTAVAVFAYLAFQVLASDQGSIALAMSRQRQARLSAAAEAGLDLAIHGLAANDQGQRWSIDGRTRHFQFDGMDLAITVHDERGKAPLSGLNDAQVRALFAGAGASGARLDDLTREFHDWTTQDATDPNDTAQSGLAVATPRAPIGRGGPVLTIGELAALKDMTPDLIAAITPAVTVFFEQSGPFEASHATPLAKAAMAAEVQASPDQINAVPDSVNQSPEESLGPDDHLVGRTLTIQVVAKSRDGAQTHRMEIVELNGDPAQPYWVRYTE